LTTCGILLARHLPTPAFGAFLLFLANFTAIALGAMIVSCWSESPGRCG
jgi:hypothetical protein